MLKLTTEDGSELILFQVLEIKDQDKEWMRIPTKTATS